MSTYQEIDVKMDEKHWGNKQQHLYNEKALHLQMSTYQEIDVRMDETSKTSQRSRHIQQQQYGYRQESTANVNHLPCGSEYTSALNGNVWWLIKDLRLGE